VPHDAVDDRHDDVTLAVTPSALREVAALERDDRRDQEQDRERAEQRDVQRLEAPPERLVSALPPER
jgi:hypothetical protein